MESNFGTFGVAVKLFNLYLQVTAAHSSDRTLVARNNPFVGFFFGSMAWLPASDAGLKGGKLDIGVDR
jgi:hypothetical protein